MNMGLQLAVVVAAISEGHADLGDLLFLLAFVVFVAVVLLQVMRSPIDTVRVGFGAGLALLALALFVL